MVSEETTMLLCSSGSAAASRIERWLSARHFNVQRCLVIADLIRHFEEGPPDLIIADVSEGQYEFLRVAHRLRQRAGAHTVVVSAGEVTTERPLSALGGADAILFQPLSESATISQLQLLIQLMQARRDLGEARSQLEAIALSRQNGLALLDPDGNIVFHNRALARMFGYTSEQLQRMKIWELATPTGRKAVRAANFDLHDDPHGTSGVVGRWQRRDGHLVDIEIDAHRFFTQERVGGLVFEVRDIADELALRQIMLEQPLANVDAAMLLSRLEELRSDVEALDRLVAQGATADAIRERAGAARNTLDRLLESNLPVEDVDLAQVLREVLDQYARHREDGVSLEVSIPDHLPPVRGRAAELRRILANFLADAVASVRALQLADGAGEVRVAVEVVEAGEGPERVTLTIRDNGLPAEHFARYDNRASMRLDRARSRVSLWGGHVRITAAQDGIGSLVTVDLAIAGTRARPAPGAAEPAGDILLVEDEVREHQIISAMLQRAGYRVTGVADDRAAERVLQERAFDLIIVDANVPEVASDRGIGRLRRLAPRVPVILMGGAQATVGEHFSETRVVDAESIDSILDEVQRILR